MSGGTLTVTAARPFWGAIRDFLAECREGGDDITVTEGRGWWIRHFVVRGDPRALRVLKATFDLLGARYDRRHS